MTFSVELTVSTTGYVVNNKLWLDRHIEGEYLFRDTLTIKATPTPTGWNVRYLLTDERWSDGTGTRVEQEGKDYVIPLSSKKGFKGQLRLTIQSWH